MLSCGANALPDDTHAGIAHAPAKIETLAKIETPAQGPLAPLTRVQDYRSVFEACTGVAQEKRLALRRMSVDDRALLLTVDPATLATSLEEARAWTCTPTDEAAQADTRFGRALRTPTPAPAARILRNEGVTHGASDGSFVTGDLCPSRRPLDRAFLDRFAQTGAHAPIALSISGLWLIHHAEDFRWLQQQRNAGALDITWVTHSFSHPYDPRRLMAQDFMLRPGLDMAHEVLDTERLLVAQGETPSVFFRFPGLIADDAAVAALRAFHLIALGADAWLVLSPTVPHAGAIILVHPNGNEPAGLRLFARHLESGRLPRPFRPIIDAPSP